MNNTSKEREGITKGCRLLSFKKKEEQAGSTTQGSKHLLRSKEKLGQSPRMQDETHPYPWDLHTSPCEQWTKKTKGQKLSYGEELRTCT